MRITEHIPYILNDFMDETYEIPARVYCAVSIHHTQNRLLPPRRSRKVTLERQLIRFVMAVMRTRRISVRYQNDMETGIVINWIPTFPKIMEQKSLQGKFRLIVGAAQTFTKYNNSWKQKWMQIVKIYKIQTK